MPTLIRWQVPTELSPEETRVAAKLRRTGKFYASFARSARSCSTTHSKRSWPRRISPEASGRLPRRWRRCVGRNPACCSLASDSRRTRQSFLSVMAIQPRCCRRRLDSSALSGRDCPEPTNSSSQAQHAARCLRHAIRSVVATRQPAYEPQHVFGASVVSMTRSTLKLLMPRARLSFLTAWARVSAATLDGERTPHTSLGRRVPLERAERRVQAPWCPQPIQMSFRRIACVTASSRLCVPSF